MEESNKTAQGCLISFNVHETRHHTFPFAGFHIFFFIFQTFYDKSRDCYDYLAFKQRFFILFLYKFNVNRLMFQ